ncbi:MAG TPA: ParB/RepB/Spo0J family partition protein [Gemmataceae bacterium]|nr:ParB/RepB/Spo0J family partition protein [Gemmataceae bacterium]
MEKRRLARGLDALLGIAENGTATEHPPTDQAQVPVAQIEHNPFQPRKTFDQEELASLSASVRSHGILQPLVVRVKDGKYQLVAGERRLRAAQEVGLTSVPVRVVNFNDQEILEAALIENIQRTDLNPIEKAQGFKDYLERFGMTHEELAKRIGLARATITNLVNLLELAHEVQEAVRVNQISEGHAKLLKGVKDQQQQLALCRQIIAQGLSVKAAETFLREQREEKPATDPDGKGGAVAEPEEKTAHVRSIEDELRQKLSTKVEIKVRGKDKGQIVLRFETNDDFMRLLEVLRR